MGSESKQMPEMKDPADASEALNELLENGEISAEAYAEYSATADAALSFSAGSSPHTRQAAMFDHITLRVADLAIGSSAFAAALDQLEIEQTTNTPTLSVWGNFALTQTDEEHPIARRVHIAFIAPTQAHVDRFLQAGVDVGFADDGAAGPRPEYADDYYAAFLKDAAGNGFEARTPRRRSAAEQYRSRRHPRHRRRSVNRLLLHDRRGGRPHHPAAGR